MARPTDPNSSVRDILAKLDRSIDQARAKRMEDEHGVSPDQPTNPTGHQQARPLRARPMRNGPPSNEPDTGGKWIGKAND